MDDETKGKVLQLINKTITQAIQTQCSMNNLTRTKVVELIEDFKKNRIPKWERRRMPGASLNQGILSAPRPTVYAEDVKKLLDEVLRLLAEDLQEQTLRFF